MTEVDSKLAGNSRASLAFYRVARNILVGLCRLWFRMRVSGREHVPRSGPFVLAPVHRSNLDTPIAAAVTTRRLRFMGKDSLWKVTGFSWLLSALGGFPVTRGTADREALRRMVQVLDSGEPLVVFPEGERKFGPVVQPLFDGAAYVACKANVPIVPVGIAGSERAMQKGKRFIRPVKVVVIAGPPIVPPVDDSGRVPRSAVRTVTADLHRELQRLFDEATARL